MRLITIEDFRDVYVKSIQRGRKFIFSKFSLSEKSRTKSSFNDINIDGSNWWYIPMVRERWNYLITGNKDTSYEKYVSEKFSGKKARMLSIGSGVCSHEMEFARLNPDWEVSCIDFSEKVLQSAEGVAKKEGLINMKFLVRDIYSHKLPRDYYDIILFHSSLHHFKNLEIFLQRIHDSLIPSGKLIINEYVGSNRLQYSRLQLNEINRCLCLLEKKDRRIYKTNLYKNRYYGSGLFRMIMSDPSECIESAKIIPTIHNKFGIVEEKGYGGNLLMPVLKDIAHNFLKSNERNKSSLARVFEYEDKYLKANRSDFVFGIYERTK